MWGRGHVALSIHGKGTPIALGVLAWKGPSGALRPWGYEAKPPPLISERSWWLGLTVFTTHLVTCGHWGVCTQLVTCHSSPSGRSWPRWPPRAALGGRWTVTLTLWRGSSSSCPESLGTFCFRSLWAAKLGSGFRLAGLRLLAWAYQPHRRNEPETRPPSVCAVSPPRQQGRVGVCKSGHQSLCGPFQKNRVGE